MSGSARKGAERGRVGVWIASAWLFLVVVGGALAPWLPLQPVEGTDVRSKNRPPSLAHLFGTDSIGRDVFSRTVWGARVSLLVGVTAVVIGVVIGGSLGLMAGYLRRATDRTISFVFDSLLAFPAIVFAVLVTSLTGRSMVWVTLVLGVLSVAPMGRLARATTLTVASQPFVEAATSLGATPTRIIRREVVPNVVPTLMSFTLIGCGIAIVAEGSLAFLGLSVEGSVSWGTIIVDGSSGRTLRIAPHVALLPITVLFLTVLSLNWIGSVVQRRADSRISKL
jgi:peptide/nickel transport system permease protein